VKQVLLCLQSNALKFTQGGIVEIQVEIIAKAAGRFLQVAVRDNGVGISKSN
jgi:signal transduction histidine kinase